ncbi:MAG: hypothetical protein DRH08_07525 [Deltaproteobacteria bacterium]|nr:MAG: hypothetical protein DRH08_07525 [Deltaproteobacteria bacterium]
MLGYAWCLGDDGHVEVKYATADGCCDSDFVNSHAVRPDVAMFHQSDDNHCGPCIDFAGNQSDAVFSKRLKKDPPVSVDVIAPSSFSPTSAHNAKLVVGYLMSQPPLRTPQAILAHRTVVLLN